MRRFSLWYFLLLPALLCVAVSCEEEFSPELDKYDDLLVVDGLLTNGDPSVMVKLSVSSRVYDKKYIPLADAVVFISDQDNDIVTLSETSSGTYKSADSTFRGQAGNVYQLHIELPNGRNYISDACILKPSVPIDSVYGLAQNPELGEIDFDAPGLQFYVENHSQASDTNYYLWRLAQTWKYRSSFNIDYTWQGQLIPYPNPDSLHTCWHTTDVGQLIFASTEYLSPGAEAHFPLHYVSTETKLLSIRYSLLVKQLNISKSAYLFFNAIEQQNLDQGDLWSKQPIQIRGNMHNVNHPDEPVLGFFIVAGAAEKRIFVDKPELPFYFTECTPDYDLRWVWYSPPNDWPIYIDDIMFSGLAIAERDACFDCRLDGGSIEAPDFWEE